MKNQILKLLAAFLFLGVAATANLHAQSASVFATENLITPSSMTYDRQTGDLFVTEIATGRIIRVQLP